MKTIKLILSLIMISLAGSTALAESSHGRIQLLRDKTYESDLRWEAGADKTMTPAKIVRWLKGLSGYALPAPSRTEFQPSVNVHDSNVRVIAAIAYKF